MALKQSAGRGSGILLAVLCLAQFMLILDVAVVAVALPTIQPDLGISPADIQWVGTAYALAYGGFMVAAGRMADLFGARRLMVAGLIVFAIASLGCGLAETGWVLFASRGLQGLGAALVSPAALSIVTTSFGDDEGRAKALGVWGAVSAGGAVAGQLLGGLLIGLAGWEWIFFVNVPIAALVLLAVVLNVSATPGRASGGTDVTGAALLTGAFVALVTGASQAAEQGLSAPVALLGLAAIGLLGAFWLTERRVRNPIIPLGLFRNRHVTLGNMICFASSAAVMATVFLAAMVMQQVLGASALQAGLSFAPVSAVITVVALKSGAAVARFGVRNVLLASALLIAAGSLLLAAVPAQGSFLLHVVPGLLVSGIGGGLGFAPGMLVATTGVADHQQGLASGLLSTAQQLGGVFGLAALNLVAVQAASAAGTADAAVAGYRAGFLAALALPVIMAICALALPKQSPAPMPAGDRPAAAPDPIS